jgi:hypothetical protein
MTTETQKTYHCSDLIQIIEERLPYQYPEQVGALSAALSSVLIRVEVSDPELFQEIMAFEMKCETFPNNVSETEY